MPVFQSTHNLDFLSAHWDNPANRHNWQVFKIGTCHGQWNMIDDSYVILAIINEKPGNGHLQDVFDWFENSCRRDNKSLKILHLWNYGFARHLITKRGFRYFNEEDLIKEFPASKKG
jgi:hypothetical protein